MALTAFAEVGYEEEHKDGPQPTTWAQCRLVGANGYNCSRDHLLYVPSELRRSSRLNFFLNILVMTDQRCLTFAFAHCAH
jgi:hypothetical protein